MSRLLAVALAAAALAGAAGAAVAGAASAKAVLAPFHSLIQPLSGPTRAEVKHNAWHRGCPVPLSELPVLTVSYVGFDRQPHTGQLVVNQDADGPLARAFRNLYRLHFRIRDMVLGDAYGPAASQAADVSSAFDCRQAVPSPCVGATGTGSWSEHAFGEAVGV